MTAKGVPLWEVRDDRTLSAYAKLAYLMLWSRKPDVRPSHQRLADDMGVSKSTAKLAVTELEEAGLLKRIPTKYEGGGHAPNHYYLERLSDPRSSPDLGSVVTRPRGRSPGDPKDVKVKTGNEKGEIPLASRHARPAVRREDAISLVRRAVAKSYGQQEAEDLSDGQCVALWLLLVNNRKPAKAVPYLCKIFDETPYLDTHLANAGDEEDWEAGGAFAA